MATKVCVLFGGASSEHKISLISAASVLENIPADRFETYPVGITEDGRWFYYTGPTEYMRNGTWLDSGLCTPAVLSPDTSVHGLLVFNGDTVQTIRIDAVFPVLHGKNGEDGTVQGLLDLAEIPYVGCDLISSAVCMDKAVTNMLLDAHGIPHAAWRQMTTEQIPEFEKLADEWENALGYPIFVKPANAGSSVGITKAHDRDELRIAIAEAFKYDRKLVAERCIVGKELECAVIGNLNPKASPVSQILPNNEFYDYESKYVNASITVLPAEIPEELSRRVRTTAENAFKALGCRGLARVDFLYEDATDTLYLNEPNTMPGFTSISMYPKMMAAFGYEYKELIAELITLALEDGNERK